MTHYDKNMVKNDLKVKNGGKDTNLTLSGRRKKKPGRPRMSGSAKATAAKKRQDAQNSRLRHDMGQLLAIMHNCGVPLESLADVTGVCKQEINRRIAKVGDIPIKLAYAVTDMHQLLAVALKRMRKILKGGTDTDAIRVFDRLSALTVGFTQSKSIADSKNKAIEQGVQSSTAAMLGGMTPADLIQAGQDSAARLLAYHEEQRKKYADEMQEEKLALAPETIEIENEETIEPMGTSQDNTPPTESNTSPHQNIFPQKEDS